MFSGIELFNPLEQKYVNVIPFLFYLEGDSPERVKIASANGYTAAEGCFHCDLNLLNNNILVKEVGNKKTILHYLKSKKLCEKFAEDLVNGDGPRNKIENEQKKSGFTTYDIFIMSPLQLKNKKFRRILFWAEFQLHIAL
jgi:hypothetical protein